MEKPVDDSNAARAGAEPAPLEDVEDSAKNAADAHMVDSTKKTSADSETQIAEAEKVQEATPEPVVKSESQRSESNPLKRHRIDEGQDPASIQIEISSDEADEVEGEDQDKQQGNDPTQPAANSDGSSTLQVGPPPESAPSTPVPAADPKATIPDPSTPGPAPTEAAVSPASTAPSRAVAELQSNLTDKLAAATTAAAAVEALEKSRPRAAKSRAAPTHDAAGKAKAKAKAKTKATAAKPRAKSKSKATASGKSTAKGRGRGGRTKRGRGRGGADEHESDDGDDDVSALPAQLVDDDDDKSASAAEDDLS